MKKLITLLLVAFCLNGLNAGITLTKKYSKTDYSWNTGTHARSATYHNGKIYVIDKNGKKIQEINATDGSVGTAISDANFTGFSVTVDEVGNKYVTSGGFGMTNNIQGTLIVGETKTYANTALSGTGRIDFVSAHGDFANEGYLAGATVNTADNILIWKIQSGAFVNAAAPVVISGKRGNFYTGADINWIDETHLLVTGASAIPKIIELDLETPANSTSTSIGSANFGVGGGAYFKVLGRPYVALGSTQYGVVKVYDIANPASPVLIGETTQIAALANTTLHLSILAVVDGNKATIYVWSCNNGLAVYEMVVPTKTFTVTAPQGTEKVYVVGAFTFKNWDNTDPYELTATANPNEFTGTFACEDGIEYKYLNGKGNWDYQEASSLGSSEFNAIDASPVKPSDGANRSYNASDVVANWKAVSKLVLKADIAAGGVPTNLFVKGGWDGWATAVELAKNGTHDFTVTLGDGIDDVFYSNTGYKYYTTDLGSPDNWESRVGNRWAIYPSMVDEINGFETNIPATGLKGKPVALQIARTIDGISVRFDGPATVELFNVNGMLIDRANVTDVYSKNLSNGMYIIRINGESTKFVK